MNFFFLSILLVFSSLPRGWAANDERTATLYLAEMSLLLDTACFAWPLFLYLCCISFYFFDFVPFVFVRFGMLSACVLPAWIDVQRASLMSTSCIVYRPSYCLVRTHVQILSLLPLHLPWVSFFFLFACLLVFRYFLSFPRVHRPSRPSSERSGFAIPSPVLFVSCILPDVCFRLSLFSSPSTMELSNLKAHANTSASLIAPH
jgi:hypothetical protein